MTIFDWGVARPSHRSFNSMNYFLERCLLYRCG